MGFLRKFLYLGLIVIEFVSNLQAELWSLSGKEHTTLTNQSRTKRCLFTSLRVSSRQVPLRTSLTHTPTVFQEA
ncbi:MAG: hypothetical protein EB069_02810 [Actinobacteria bacterium]|nr:hypothetical protein [Actinomycetota bacterium]